MEVAAKRAEIVVDTRPLWMVLLGRSTRPLALAATALLYWFIVTREVPAQLSPQGLRAMAVFAVCLVLWVSSSPEAMRALAILVALGVLLLTAFIADRLVGRRVAVYAVLFMGTAGALPFIESFTLSGELLASLFAAATMLVFVFYLGRRSLWLIALAGLLTGCAVLMKQSGFDAGLAAVVYLLWKERDRGGIGAAALLGHGGARPCERRCAPSRTTVASR